MNVVETLGQVPTITHTVAVADFAVIFQYPHIFILPSLSQWPHAQLVIGGYEGRALRKQSMNLSMQLCFFLVVL